MGAAPPIPAHRPRVGNPRSRKVLLRPVDTRTLLEDSDWIIYHSRTDEGLIKKNVAALWSSIAAIRAGSRRRDGRNATTV